MHVYIYIEENHHLYMANSLSTWLAKVTFIHQLLATVSAPVQPVKSN